MKVKCIISHEELQPNGGFKRYEAGTVYEMETYSPGLFESVEKVEKKVKKEVTVNE